MAALGISAASMTLATLANPLVQYAYGKIVSIQNANEDLEKLATTIETIKGALLNAEKWEEEPAVKNWIKRVNDVLYDADDLFDEIAIGAELKKLNEVHDSPSTLNTTTADISFAGMLNDFSKLNPFSFLDTIVPNNTIANTVAGIRKRLDDISKDMKSHEILKFLQEAPKPVRREIQDEEPLVVGSEFVIGRDEDKKVILDMLSNDNQQNVSVIAIVGIGGMGKTTLVQLACEDEKVIKMFGDYQWDACISKTSSNEEIVGKIYQSIFRRKDDELNLSQRVGKIQSEIKGKKFLLVLDDVWDESSDSWDTRMGILSGGAKGSKVIVTTRYGSVAEAVGASETHLLKGLSDEKSWDLFKRVARITAEKERDSRWSDLGKELVKKGANVPLAIRSIASLLAEKNTIEEWELLRNVQLPKLGQNQENRIMYVLRMSYNHLASNLKPCFAYCALFPKNHRFNKDDLVRLWASQGYIKTIHDSQNIEDMSYSYFMDLVRRCFLQVHVGDYGLEWKMHDLIHDLAQEVAKEESILLTTSPSKIVGARHVSLRYTIDDSWAESHPSFSVNKLRSFFYQYRPLGSLTLEKQFANLKCLRVLGLSTLFMDVVPESIGELKHLRYLDISSNRIKDVPNSIGKLKYLRYLDISENAFEMLPDDIVELVNLCTLNISKCMELEALPSGFRKLTNLRSLNNGECHRLKCMPCGFEELTSLQHLDEFRVSREIDGVQTSKLDVLSRLKLTGELRIWIHDETYDWGRVNCWQPPLTLQVLRIYGYQGLRIPHWGNGSTVNQASLLPKLTALCLSECTRIKFLPPFRHLPFLSCIQLEYLPELETIQGEEEEGIEGSDALYLPANLKTLLLRSLPKLKSWWNVAAASASTLPPLSSLYELKIGECPQLNEMPLCPYLQKLNIVADIKVEIVQQLLGVHDNHSPFNSIQPSSLQLVKVLLTLIGSTVKFIQKLLGVSPNIQPSSLQSVQLSRNDDLVSFPGESFTSLRHLEITSCSKLNKVQLAPLGSNILEKLALLRCPELELWEENKRGVDWDSLTELTTLFLSEVPSSENLPYCLRQRQERGVLKIHGW